MTPPLSQFECLYIVKGCPIFLPSLSSIVTETALKTANTSIVVPTMTVRIPPTRIRLVSEVFSKIVKISGDSKAMRSSSISNVSWTEGATGPAPNVTVVKMSGAEGANIPPLLGPIGTKKQHKIF